MILLVPLLSALTLVGAISPSKRLPLLTNAVQRNDPQASPERAALRTTGAAVKPLMSDAFAESLGVNTRFAGGIYRSAQPDVENYLVGLGFRHIRDGGVFVNSDVRAYLQSLCTRHGIHSSLLTRDTDSDPQILGYVHDVPCLDMVEGPNELDAEANWAQRLAAFVPHLYQLIRGTPDYKGIPIVAPSLGGAYEHNQQLAQTIDVSQFVDYGNKHSYPSGRNPGGPDGTGFLGFGRRTTNGCPAYFLGSFYGDVCASQLVTKNRPLWTTETGYNSTPSGAPYQPHPPFGSIPYNVAAKYFPRLMAYEFMSGITRTYIMALVDSASGCNGPYYTDGLVEQDCPNTGTAASLHPKPAFFALKNLMATVSDPGPDFTPTPLMMKIGGGDPRLQTLLLQKRGGQYILLFWVEASDWNVDAGAPVAVAPEQIKLSITGVSSRDATKFGIDSLGALTAPETVRFSGGDADLTATDSIQFLKFSAPPHA